MTAMSASSLCWNEPLLHRRIRPSTTNMVNPGTYFHLVEATFSHLSGKIVVRILNALPRRSQIRQQAMADLATWIARYDDEYGGESDDHAKDGDESF